MKPPPLTRPEHRNLETHLREFRSYIQTRFIDLGKRRGMTVKKTVKLLKLVDAIDATRHQLDDIANATGVDGIYFTDDTHERNRTKHQHG